MNPGIKWEYSKVKFYYYMLLSGELKRMIEISQPGKENTISQNQFGKLYQWLIDESSFTSKFMTLH